MQFKKVGRGLLREAKQREGEWAVLAKAKGDKNKKLHAKLRHTGMSQVETASLAIVQGTCKYDCNNKSEQPAVNNILC